MGIACCTFGRVQRRRFWSNHVQFNIYLQAGSFGYLNTVYSTYFGYTYCLFYLHWINPTACVTYIGYILLFILPTLDTSYCLCYLHWIHPTACVTYIGYILLFILPTLVRWLWSLLYHKRRSECLRREDFRGPTKRTPPPRWCAPRSRGLKSGKEQRVLLGKTRLILAILEISNKSRSKLLRSDREHSP